MDVRSGPDMPLWVVNVADPLSTRVYVANSVAVGQTLPATIGVTGMCSDFLACLMARASMFCARCRFNDVQLGGAV